MSGECEKCGHHCMDCDCKGEAMTDNNSAPVFRAEMGHYSSIVGNSVHLIAPEGHFAGQVIIMGQDDRLREKNTQEALLHVICNALNKRPDHRSFPDAADGRPLPPMGDELMTAGLSGEDARFVATQLAQNGLVLVPADLCAADRGVTEKSDDWRKGFEVGWDERLKQERHNAAARIEVDADALEALKRENEAMREALQRVTGLYQVTHCHAAARAALASREAPPAVTVEQAARVLLAAFERAQIDSSIIKTFQNGHHVTALRALGGSN